MTKFWILGVSLLALAGCAMDREAHYWERSDPGSAIYLTGVKAQQMLEQDIAGCVHEIIELTQLADVRGRVPSGAQALGSYDQADATAGMGKLPRWDVPEYIRDLRVDHTEFHDFEGCMAYKGWRRVNYVGPAAQFRAKEIYDSTADYSVRPFHPRTQVYNKTNGGLNNEER